MLNATAGGQGLHNPLALSLSGSVGTFPIFSEFLCRNILVFCVKFSFKVELNFSQNFLVSIQCAQAIESGCIKYSV